MRITWARTRWRMFAERALFEVNSATLLIADAHFGKAATFRARGVPVPHGTTAMNLARLDALLTATGARCLVFLGDLFHAREAHAPQTLAQMAEWRLRRAALEVVLVEGNHDRHAGPVPPALGMRTVAEPWPLGDVLLCHHPQVSDAAPVLAGHLHPAVRLHGRVDGVLLPCFWWRERLAVLPAFGEFTGAASIDREPGDRVIAVAEQRLYEIPPLRSPTAA